MILASRMTLASSLQCCHPLVSTLAPDDTHPADCGISMIYTTCVVLLFISHHTLYLSPLHLIASAIGSP